MKQMQFILILMAGFIMMFSAVAQVPSFDWEALDERSNRMEGKLTGTIYHLPVEVSSRHFYHDKWMNGDVLMEDGDLYKNLHLRYLAFGDQLAAYNSNLHQMFIIDKKKVSRFTIRHDWEEQKFVKVYHHAGISGQDRFFEIMYEGNRCFLVFHQIVEEKTGIYRNEYGKLRDTELKNRETWFMYDPVSGKFNYLYKSRRSLLRHFPDNKKDIRRIFRRNHLYRFDELEMVHAFRLLDEAGFFEKK
jgi:hypothetical protein